MNTDADIQELLEIARLLSLLTDEGDDRLHGAYHARDGHVRAKGSTLELIERARAVVKESGTQ